MTYVWYDILGTLGVAVIIMTYVLLQLGKVRSEQLVYSVLNAVQAKGKNAVWAVGPKGLVVKLK